MGAVAQLVRQGFVPIALEEVCHHGGGGLRSLWLAVAVGSGRCGGRFSRAAPVAGVESAVRCRGVALPWLGTAWRKIETARFLLVLGALLNAEVQVTEALKAARASLMNTLLQEEADRICEEVNSGTAMGASFRAGSLFPPLLGSVVGAGEERHW